MSNLYRRPDKAKVRKVESDLYRITDLRGQGSQYVSAKELPDKVRKEADAKGVAYTDGYVSGHVARWTVIGGKKLRAREAA